MFVETDGHKIARFILCIFWSGNKVAVDSIGHTKHSVYFLGAYHIITAFDP